MVLLHLSINLLIVYILVLGGLHRVNSPPFICKAIAAMMLYFLFVAFSWMVAEAVLQYLKFVKVFDTYVSKFMLKATLTAYS
jgi:7 transmembrane receptor (Secretin family)